MCPDCSPPSRLPAPRISRSFIATCMPAPDLGVLGDRRQPLVRGLGQRLLRRVQEVGVAALASAPDPAAQLVQLRQAEGVAALHDQGVGVRDVDPGLDDRRRHQDIESPLPEVHHRPSRARPRPSARGRPRSAPPGPARQLRGGLVDRLDPVVDVEDLALAQQLAPDRRRDLLLVVRRRRRSAPGAAPPAGSAIVDISRMPVTRHLQRARDRRRATSSARRLRSAAA